MLPIVVEPTCVPVICFIYVIFMCRRTGVDRWGTGGGVWGDNIGIVPPPHTHFSVQKNCIAYDLA